MLPSAFRTNEALLPSTKQPIGLGAAVLRPWSMYLSISDRSMIVG